VGTAAALAGWAAVFWFLIVSNRSSLYLSPRVSWVIPAGTVLLTAFAVGHIAIARTDHPEPLTARSAALLAFVLLPAIAILVLPPAVLGSFAADRRSALTSDAIRVAVVREAEAIEASAGSDSDGPNVEGFEIGLQYVAAALRSEDAHESLARLVEMAGPRVTYEGFVARSAAMPETEFHL
jgi:hypothetical protein